MGNRQNTCGQVVVWATATCIGKVLMGLIKPNKVVWDKWVSGARGLAVTGKLLAVQQVFMVSKWFGFAAGGMLCHSDKDHVPYWDPTEMHFPIYVLELDVTTGPAVEVRLCDYAQFYREAGGFCSPSVLVGTMCSMWGKQDPCCCPNAS